jgi:hypothetical protein
VTTATAKAAPRERVPERGAGSVHRLGAFGPALPWILVFLI